MSSGRKRRCPGLGDPWEDVKCSDRMRLQQPQQRRCRKCSAERRRRLREIYNQRAYALNRELIIQARRDRLQEQREERQREAQRQAPKEGLNPKTKDELLPTWVH